MVPLSAFCHLFPSLREGRSCSQSPLLLFCRADRLLLPAPLFNSPIFLSDSGSCPDTSLDFLSFPLSSTSQPSVSGDHWLPDFATRFTSKGRVHSRPAAGDHPSQHGYTFSTITRLSLKLVLYQQAWHPPATFDSWYAQRAPRIVTGAASSFLCFRAPFTVWFIVPWESNVAWADVSADVS